MDLNTKANRDRLIAAFPDLGDDENFEIQSPQNPIYNCIAWAMGYTDRWVTIEWSDKQSPPWYWWPNGVPRDLSPSSLIKAFEAEGFELVGEPTVDSETELVALYKNEITNQWTHASRVISCGIEHSLL